MGYGAATCLLPTFRRSELSNPRPHHSTMPNITLALRALFRSPFVTGVAVLSLALGIGANAAIFSLFDEILLRPLTVPRPEQQAPCFLSCTGSTQL